MTDLDLDMAASRIAELRALTIRSESLILLENAFESLFNRRLAELRLSKPVEARGLALLGSPGAGKSTMLAAAIKSVKRNCKSGDNAIIFCSVPSPASLKHVGAAILNALGYPMSSDRPAHYIWRRVRELLLENRTLILVLDEAQDLVRSRSAADREAVINTLKSLMQAPDWPVSLVLAGVPQFNKTQGLRPLLDHDQQLSRRLSRIELPNLTLEEAERELQVAVHHFARHCEVEVKIDFRRTDFFARLLVAANEQFGLAIEFIVDALSVAVHSGTPVTVEAFGQVFFERTAAKKGFNPFYANAFEDLDGVLPSEPDEES